MSPGPFYAWLAAQPRYRLLFEGWSTRYKIPFNAHRLQVLLRHMRNAGGAPLRGEMKRAHREWRESRDPFKPAARPMVQGLTRRTARGTGLHKLENFTFTVLFPPEPLTEEQIEEEADRWLSRELEQTLRHIERRFIDANLSRTLGLPAAEESPQRWNRVLARWNAKHRGVV